MTMTCKEVAWHIPRARNVENARRSQTIPEQVPTPSRRSKRGDAKAAPRRSPVHRSDNIRLGNRYCLQGQLSGSCVTLGGPSGWGTTQDTQKNAPCDPGGGKERVVSVGYISHHIGGQSKSVRGTTVSHHKRAAKSSPQPQTRHERAGGLMSMSIVDGTATAGL